MSDLRGYEPVVLLNSENHPIGECDKKLIHTLETPLHLGFSCYIINSQNEVLITRRALNKATWPGVWSNSVCGHPLPSETVEQAAQRRALYELGMQISTLKIIDDNFYYYASDACGIVENEFCPVLMAYCDAQPQPAASEVMDYKWVALETLLDSALPWLFSPWMIKQISKENIRHRLLNLAE